MTAAEDYLSESRAVTIDEREIAVAGLPAHYLVAGEGPPLLLLHGDGESAHDWRRVLPGLARTHRVVAPDLPGFGGSAKPPGDYSPASFARFAAALLDALEIERATVVGNSLGGLVALRLALAEPGRVSALVLAASAGLGRAVSPLISSLTWPVYGELAIAWARTPLGARQRAQGRGTLLFGRPERVPDDWVAEQARLARRPGFLEAALTALRATTGPTGQRDVVLDRLPSLTMPTLVVWGERDRVFPLQQAREAVARLPHGRLALLPDCGHLPPVECPDAFLAAVAEFLEAETPAEGARASA